MKIATNICKIKGKRGYKWPSFEEAHAFFFPEIEYTEIHRGADDAYHEADLVYKLIKMGKFKL